MKKTIFALLLVVALAAVLAIPALAEEAGPVYHCVCGAQWFDAEGTPTQTGECADGCVGEKFLKWEPFGQDDVMVSGDNTSVPVSGYYYLTEDVNVSYTTYPGALYIDLNGKSLTRTQNRVFHLTGDTSDVHITDTSSKKDGVVASKKYAAGDNGAVIEVDKGKFTLHAGIIDASQAVNSEKTPVRGGAILVQGSGAVHMYGGTISGGKAQYGGNVAVGGVGSEESDSNTGAFYMYGGLIAGGDTTIRGGNVHIAGSGAQFIMEGGTITDGEVLATSTQHGGNIMVRAGGTFKMTDGTVSNGNAGGSGSNGGNIAIVHSNSKVTINGGSITGGTATSGPCVWKNNGTMTVSGDPEIDSIYLLKNQKISVVEDGLQSGASIGILMETAGVFVSSGASESDVAYFYGASGKHSVRYADTALSLAVTPWKLNGTGDRLTHDEAKAALKDGDYLQLQYNWGTAPEFSGDVCLDLNGHTLTGLKIIDGKLNLFDSETNDYDVSDGVYGKITGDITADEIVPAFVASNGYRYVTVKTNEGYSAHRFYLAVTHSVLRNNAQGLGFKTMLKCNDKVKNLVTEYGIDLTINGNPVTEDLIFGDALVAGENVGTIITTGLNGLTGDAVKGYMEAEQGVNAYIKIGDTVIESAVKTTTVQKAYEAALATNLTADQMETMKYVYNTYGQVGGMDSWTGIDKVKS